MVYFISHGQGPSVIKATNATWIIDSGAISHVCSDRTIFTLLEMIEPVNICIGERDHDGVKRIGRGSINVNLPVSEKTFRGKFEDVAYAPNMGFNFLSVRVVNRYGCKTIFDDKSCVVVKGNKVQTEGSLINGLYSLKTFQSTDSGRKESAIVADMLISATIALSFLPESVN